MSSDQAKRKQLETLIRVYEQQINQTIYAAESCRLARKIQELEKQLKDMR